MSTRLRIFLLSVAAMVSLALANESQARSPRRLPRCLAPSPRSAALVSWLATALTSNDSSWRLWRANTGFSPVSQSSVTLLQDDSTCARGARAVHQANQFSGSEPAAVHVVRLDNQGFGVTFDSLYSVGSLMLLTDSAFASRSFQQWRDTSARP